MLNFCSSWTLTCVKHDNCQKPADKALLRPQHVGGEKTNKHKQLRGIVPEMGGGQIVYVFPLFLWKKRKHINKIPRKSQEKAGRVPGQSRDNPGTIP